LPWKWARSFCFKKLKKSDKAMLGKLPKTNKQKETKEKIRLENIVILLQNCFKINEPI